MWVVFFVPVLSWLLALVGVVVGWVSGCECGLSIVDASIWMLHVPFVGCVWCSV